MKQLLVLNIGRKTIYKTLFVLSICLFLSWTTTSSNSPYIFSKKPLDYYNLQTEAFINFQTALLKLPDARLLALKNPYDPIANAQYRFHDLSLYKSKYYLYFGVTPVITLLLPFRLITGTYLPVNLATLIFIIIGVYYSVKILVHIKKNLGIEHNLGDEFLLLLIFTFCTGAPLLLRWANIYELAVTSASSCAIAGIYYLNYSMLNCRKSIYTLLISSTLFGLAIAARPNLIFLILIVLSYFVVQFCIAKIKSHDAFSLRIIFNLSSLSLVIPFIAILSALFAYNYMRFDNFLEFGHRYQLSGEIKDPGVRETSLPLHASNIISHLHHYLTQKICITPHFPYLTYDISKPIDFTSHEFSVEPTFGLIAVFPLYILSIFSSFVFFHKSKSNIIFILSIAAITNFLVSCSFSGTTGRYMMDFAPYLLICAIATYYAFYNYNYNKFIRKLIISVFIISTLCGSLSIILLSLSGYGDRCLQYQNYLVFGQLAQLFGDKTEQVKQLRLVKITGEFKLPPTDFKKQSQALITSGHKGCYDSVVIDYSNDNSVRFGFIKYLSTSEAALYLPPYDIANAVYSKSSHETLYGPLIKLTQDKAHTFEFDYSQMTGLMKLKIDDILYYETLNPMFPTNSSSFNVGGTSFGPKDAFKNFSGMIKINEASAYFAEPGPWFPRL